MRSAEYRKTVPLKFLIMYTHNYANVWMITEKIKITSRFSGSNVTQRHCPLINV